MLICDIVFLGEHVAKKGIEDAEEREGAEELVVYNVEGSSRASGKERVGSVDGGDRQSNQGMEEGICSGHS